MNNNLEKIIAATGKKVHFPDRTVLFRENDPCQGMLLVNEGAIRVQRHSEDGKTALLYRVSNDHLCILSVSCLIGNRSYNAEGITEGTVDGFFLEQARFMDLLNREPEFREFIFMNFSVRILELIQRLDDLTFKSLKERLKNLLQETPETHKTHQELAVELGTGREVVSRLLKSLEDQGQIEMSRNLIRWIGSESD